MSLKSHAEATASVAGMSSQLAGTWIFEKVDIWLLNNSGFAVGIWRLASFDDATWIYRYMCIFCVFSDRRKARPSMESLRPPISHEWR